MNGMMSMSMPVVPCYGIDETTTFWSQDLLLAILAAKLPGITFGDVNNAFRVGFTQSERSGPQWFLHYGSVRVLELYFQGANFNDDWVRLETLLENKESSKFKFKLCVTNREPWYEWQGSEGSAPPLDIHIRPVEYNPRWQLAWKYTTAKDGQPTIEIARIEGFEFTIIHTLHASDLGMEHKATFSRDGKPLTFARAGGEEWMRKRKPILMHKHWTYITISMSAHLARKWEVAKNYTPEKMSDPWPNHESHVMSEGETAWISDDDRATAHRLSNEWIETHLQGAASAPSGGLKAMLTKLQKCALAE
jgi:hypothetical protein